MTTETHTEIELTVLDPKHGTPVLTSLPQAHGGQMTALPKHNLPLESQSNEETDQFISGGRSILVTLQLAGINFITTYNTGLITVALPAMSQSLNIRPSLLLWPMSAYTLTMATCLLPAGAIADVVGARPANLAGCFFISLFVLVSSFSHTGTQLIVFRALQGIAGAFAVPTSLSIVSRSIESGSKRNLAFSVLGLAQILGFSLGLVFGGLFVSGPGWRVGEYVGGAVGFLLFTIGLWAVPVDAKEQSETSVWTRLITEVDWIGACCASVSIALLSYVLAMLSADISNTKQSTNIALLVLSVALIPTFVYWMHRQENRSNPALIPNSLWKNKTFASICIMVLLSIALISGFEMFSSLFFQEIQELSALDTGIRFFPGVVVGILTRFTIGLFINKVPAIYIVVISCVLCAAAPLLMALIDPSWSYWQDAFIAQTLAPLSVDVLFTVGILIISDVFPAKAQTLAGAVFNVCAQLGASIGLCTLQVISAAVTKESRSEEKASSKALMEGYRAAFWTTFAFGMTACLVGAFGVRTVGKVGLKRD